MKKLLSLILALIFVFSLASCGSSTANGGNVGKVDENGNKIEDGKDKVTTVEAADFIKAAKEANKHLTQANFFFVEDGTIITLGGDSEKRYAGEFVKLTGVKQLIAGAGLDAYALTESGELYGRYGKIADNVSIMQACTTNSNVECFCVINNNLVRIASYTNLDKSYNSEFKNYPTGETAKGEIVFLEVDKHDFVALNSEGTFYAYWTSEAYNDLDFTGFEGLAVIDIAKHMDTMKNELKSLTIAGIKADGTVVATGTYANDILSWGKLADIAMADGIIVGLTADGKVKMTGDYAEKMKDIVEGWTNIVAIEAGYANGSFIDNIVSAIDSNGIFHYACIMNEYNKPETGYVSVDGIEGKSGYKYTADGSEYYEKDNKWEKD